MIREWNSSAPGPRPRLSRRRLEASASRCTMARQLDRSPWGIFTRNMKVKTLDSWPVLRFRRRLQAFPLAGLVHARHGHVAEFLPRFVGIEVVQGDAGQRGFLIQADPAAGGRVQIEQLAVRGCQANEIGNTFHQRTEDRIGVCPQDFADFAHFPAPFQTSQPQEITAGDGGVSRGKNPWHVEITVCSSPRPLFGR